MKYKSNLSVGRSAHKLTVFLFLNSKSENLPPKKNLKLLISVQKFILPARQFRAARSAARSEFRSSYF